MILLKDKFKLIGLSIGIFVCHIFMGIIIEIIFKTDYNGEKFNFPVAFVAVKNITYAFIAKVFALTCNHPPNETPQKYFMLAAIFYFLAMTTSNMALTYVSYPMQVIVKACKPLPVLLASVFIVGKSYTIQKYFLILVIVVGVVLFTYKRDLISCENGFASVYGDFLLGISLIMDGFTSAAQDIMRKNSKPSTLNFMIFNNFWSGLISIVVLASTEEATSFFFFCLKFPKVLIYLGVAVLTGFFGQYFISSIILSFGSLPCSIVTTLRKFSSVLLSIFIFNNNLTLQQWMATVIIFSGLALDILFGSKRPGENSETIDSNKNKVIDAENSGEEKEKSFSQ